MTAQVIKADAVKWLKGNEWLFQNGYLPKYHAVFADPPYFLGSIVKRFGAKNAAPAAFGKDGKMARLSKGFMGKTWDGFDSMEHYQEWVTEWATLLLSAVYPGAIGMFFGGTRTYHRLATGLENAGWEIIDCIAYMYGSGFPKSHDVGRGYGTALKPSYEPVVIARAPRGNHTFIQLFEQMGTGAYNIDGGRISTDEKLVAGGNLKPNSGDGRMGASLGMFQPNTPNTFEQNPFGRWPANLILSHTEECTDVKCADTCPIKQLGDQSGELKAGGNVSGKEPSTLTKIVYGRWERKPWDSHGDSGTAARFFYTSKPTTWEREAGLEDFTPKPLGLSNQAQAEIKRGNLTSLDDATYGIGKVKQVRNSHPTLKPISVTEYLSKLLLPPLLNEPRRILVPFCGSGSEMIGAHFAGWDEIIGIEREAEYAEIANARLKWWTGFKTYEAASKTKEVKPTELLLPNGITIKQMEMFAT